MDICAQEGCLERLSFAVDLTLHARRRASLEDSYHNQIPIAHMEDNEWDAALVIVESMARYKAWENVYVHMSWPWHNPFNQNSPYNCTEEAQDVRELQEAVLEQQVMGPNYLAEGKRDRRHRWNGHFCDYEDCEDCDIC